MNGRLTTPFRRAAEEGRYHVTGRDLREWRLSQPGEYGDPRRILQGWSQPEAADWYGCAVRTWRAWELGRHPVPVPVVKAIIRYSESVKAYVDRLMA